MFCQDELLSADCRPLLHALIHPGVATGFGVEIDQIKCSKAHAFLRQSAAALLQRGLVHSKELAVPVVKCSAIEKVPLSGDSIFRMHILVYLGTCTVSRHIPRGNPVHIAVWNDKLQVKTAAGAVTQDGKGGHGFAKGSVVLYACRENTCQEKKSYAANAWLTQKFYFHPIACGFITDVAPDHCVGLPLHSLITKDLIKYVEPILMCAKCGASYNVCKSDNGYEQQWLNHAGCSTWDTQNNIPQYSLHLSIALAKAVYSCTIYIRAQMLQV